MYKVGLRILFLASLGAYAKGDTVTLYGRVNNALQVTKIQGSSSEVKIVPQYSRFGLKGEEEIGEVITEFKIEHSIDSAGTTISPLASREVFIGIKGSWGGLKLGKIATPAFDLFDSNIQDDGLGSYSISAFDKLSLRSANSIHYYTPEVAHLRLFLQASLNNASTTMNHFMDGSLIYGSNQPFTTGVAFRTGKDSVSDKRDTFYLFLCQYQNPTFLINMFYEHDYFQSSVLGDEDTKLNKLTLSGQYNIRNVTFLASGGVAQNFTIRQRLLPETGAFYYSFGFQYNLSQQTRLYGFYTQLSNKEKASYHFISDTPIGKDNKALVLGLRYLF
jgi:predicted porin